MRKKKNNFEGERKKESIAPMRLSENKKDNDHPEKIIGKIKGGDRIDIKSDFENFIIRDEKK